MNRVLLRLATLTLVIAACSGGGSPTPNPSPNPNPNPSPTPNPSPGANLTTAELKVVLIESFGPLWYCDPDFYPIAHEDEATLAIQHFAEVQADAESFAAFVAHLQIDPTAAFSDAQKLAI